MLNHIFDTHAHYDDERFEGLLNEVFECQRANGVDFIINNGSDEQSSLASIALAEKYSFVYASVGIHPQSAGALTGGWLNRIEEMTKNPKVVAIGEIGLDYHFPEPAHDLQAEIFRAQLGLAVKLGMPIEVHDRDAHQDTFDILCEYHPSGCLHRYSGSPEMASEIVQKLGMSLGIGGALTYKNSKKEVETVRTIPLEFLILETDCPYLAPAGRRGRTSTSDMISAVAEKIAQIKGDVSAQEVLDITCSNAKKLFGIK
ncbi:MAG: TatD family hydrolase [Oscillospiraceae bacterium]